MVYIDYLSTKDMSSDGITKALVTKKQKENRLSYGLSRGEHDDSSC